MFHVLLRSYTDWDDGFSSVSSSIFLRGSSQTSALVIVRIHTRDTANVVLLFGIRPIVSVKVVVATPTRPAVHAVLFCHFTVFLIKKKVLFGRIASRFERF